MPLGVQGQGERASVHRQHPQPEHRKAYYRAACEFFDWCDQADPALLDKNRCMSPPGSRASDAGFRRRPSSNGWPPAHAVSAGGQPGPGRKSRRRGAPAFDGPPDETVQRLFPLSSNNGANNTASGFTALQFNTTGIDDTANGAHALQNNTNGPYNTADGFQALAANTTGGLDTATGVNALFKNTTGQQNTAVGVNAMLNNTTGSNNIALGYQAGSNLTTGSNNIDIGNHGVAAESNTIRIGTQGTQTATYIAGISGAGVTGGAPVEVTSAGQLGIVMSSARYKRDIRDMGGQEQRSAEAASGDLPLQQRPGRHLAVRAGGGGGGEGLSGAGGLRRRRQGYDGALLDAQRDAAQRAAEAEQRIAQSDRHQPAAGRTDSKTSRAQRSTSRAKPAAFNASGPVEEHV